MQHASRRFQSVHQVAEILHVTHPYVYRLIKTGRIRSFKFGTRGCLRISEEDLNQFIEEATTKARLKPKLLNRRLS
jgi:excisionase family DNA binding protein